MSDPTYGKSLRLELPEDADDRVSATLEAMRAMIHHTDTTQHVHRLATEMVADLPNRDRVAQVQAVFDLLRARDEGGAMNFKPDTFGKEVLRHPDQLVKEIREHGATSGDCDDRAMLGSALLRAMGWKTVLIVVGKRAGQPYQHVFFGVVIGRKGRERVFPIDPQECDRPGISVRYERRKIVNVD
jgi:hypothetical protein